MRKSGKHLTSGARHNIKKRKAKSGITIRQEGKAPKKVLSKNMKKIL